MSLCVQNAGHYSRTGIWGKFIHHHYSKHHYCHNITNRPSLLSQHHCLFVVCVCYKVTHPYCSLTSRAVTSVSPHSITSSRASCMNMYWGCSTIDTWQVEEFLETHALQFLEIRLGVLTVPQTVGVGSPTWTSSGQWDTASTLQYKAEQIPSLSLSLSLLPLSEPWSIVCGACFVHSWRYQ